jgi:maleylacetoacetate isomerase
MVLVGGSKRGSCNHESRDTIASRKARQLMTLRLFYVVGANSCERVRWALDYKRLPYVLVDPGDVLEAARFLAMSPFGRVPVLEIDGVPLTESMAIVELLEELSPLPPLNYEDPFARARVREICEAVNASIHPVQTSSAIHYLRPEWSRDEMRPRRAEWIATHLSKLEPRLWLESSYATGPAFTLADIFVAAIFQKGVSLGVAPSALPRFASHWSFLMSTPAIADSCPMGEHQRHEVVRARK